MKNLTTQESSSCRYQTSKTSNHFGALLLVLLLSIGFIQKQVNAVVIGVNPVTDFVIGSPVIESFDEATWTSILGREITTLVNNQQAPGEYSLNFDASDIRSGIYFYRITTTGTDGSNFSDTKKMMLIK